MRIRLDIDIVLSDKVIEYEFIFDNKTQCNI
jgi:hypothetical protein